MADDAAGREPGPYFSRVYGLVRRCADQLESDLEHRYPGERRPLHQWWRTVGCGTGELTSRRLLVLIDGLPDTCATWVALGADPWTLEQHLLRDIANSGRSTDALLFNVNRDREKTEPRLFDPIPAPERVLTHEQQAALEAERAAEQQRQALAEQSSVITHDIGTLLFSGQLTMTELSRRIRAEGRIDAT